MAEISYTLLDRRTGTRRAAGRRPAPTLTAPALTAPALAAPLVADRPRRTAIRLAPAPNHPRRVAGGVPEGVSVGSAATVRSVRALVTRIPALVTRVPALVTRVPAPARALATRFAAAGLAGGLGFLAGLGGWALVRLAVLDPAGFADSWVAHAGTGAFAGMLAGLAIRSAVLVALVERGRPATAEPSPAAVLQAGLPEFLRRAA